MKHALAAALLACTLATTAVPAFGQSNIGCDTGSAASYEGLAAQTRAYLAALGPNINEGNYPADMREEVAAFSEERIELYRRLEQFIATTEDFAYQIRRCSRK